MRGTQSLSDMPTLSGFYSTKSLYDEEATLNFQSMVTLQLFQQFQMCSYLLPLGGSYISENKIL